MNIFYTTFPDQGAAEKICSQMVKENIIRCANIIPGGISIYEWGEKIEKLQEVYAILKTKNDFNILENFLSENHPYDTHCLIQISHTDINGKYLDWLNN